MGHYDDEYVASDKEHNERVHVCTTNDLRSDFESKVPNMTTGEMKLLRDVINNMDDYMGFFNVIRKNTR